MIYLDNAATTPVDGDVIKAITPYLENHYGNPASQHLLGREAADAVLSARDKIAELFGCKSEEVYFTSGGTENGNWALKGVCAANMARGKHIIVSAIEHPAVLESARDMEKFGFEVSYILPEKNGAVDPEKVERAIKSDTVFCAVMSANNETGVIQPYFEIGDICKRAGVFYYSDCVQSAGYLPFPTGHCSAFGISSHKFYGLKGFGAMYIEKGSRIARLLSGGKQERGLRGGTTNAIGAIGCAVALEKAVKEREENLKKIAALRDTFVKAVTENIGGVHINGGGNILPGHANLSFDGCDGENILFLLDLQGVAVSTGSACSAGAVTPSHVLTSMGLDESRVKSAVRFTFGKYNSEEEVFEAVQKLKSAVENIRAKQKD